MAHTRGKRKEETKRMLGTEAEYKTFRTSLLDSSPRACFAMTHSTEREKPSEKRIPSQFEGAQVSCLWPRGLVFLIPPSSHLPTKYWLGMREINACLRSRELSWEGSLRARLGRRGQRAGRIPPGKAVRPRTEHSSSRSNQTLGLI